MESEQPAERASVVHGSESGVSAPSTTAYSALLAERNESKNRCDALMVEKKSIQCLMEEAKQLRAKVANME